MVRRFVMLQKKLQELESELGDVFRLPRDHTAAQHMPFDDIKERFGFLDKLLAAEAESQQPQNANQLRDIDQRITQLKAAFSDWNQSRSCGFVNNDDALSICSDCTQALLHESASPTTEDDDFSGDKLLEKDEREAAALTGREIGKYCVVFGCGMIVGAVCTVLNLFYADYYLIRDEGFFIPPT